MILAKSRVRAYPGPSLAVVVVIIVAIIVVGDMQLLLSLLSLFIMLRQRGIMLKHP